MALQILASALLASSSPITTAAFHIPSLIGTKHHLPSQIIRRELMASTSSSHDDDPSTSTSPAPSFQYTQLQDNTSTSSKISCNRDLQHVLTTIETAAYQAGQLALQTAGKIAIKSTKANIRDLVTESDLACQVVIRDTIMKEFRNDVFLGEEDVETGDLASSEALRMALGVASQSREGGVADEGEDRLLFVVVGSCAACYSLYLMMSGDCSHCLRLLSPRFDVRIPSTAPQTSKQVGDGFELP